MQTQKEMIEIQDRFSEFINQFEKNDLQKVMNWVEFTLDIYKNGGMELFGNYFHLKKYFFKHNYYFSFLNKRNLIE
jgi:hypothetical protein